MTRKRRKPEEMVAEPRSDDGRKVWMLDVWMLNMADELTGLCLAIREGRRPKAVDVIVRLVRPVHASGGVPGHIRSDTGPEFIAKPMRGWIAAVGAETATVAPGSPWENGFVASFNARLRDELLDGEIVCFRRRPVRSTRRMPAGATQPEECGRPPSGFSGSGCKSSSIAAHKLWGTRASMCFQPTRVGSVPCFKCYSLPHSDLTVSERLLAATNIVLTVSQRSEVQSDEANPCRLHFDADVGQGLRRRPAGAPRVPRVPWVPRAPRVRAFAGCRAFLTLGGSSAAAFSAAVFSAAASRLPRSRLARGAAGGFGG